MSPASTDGYKKEKEKVKSKEGENSLVGKSKFAIRELEGEDLLSADLNEADKATMVSHDDQMNPKRQAMIVRKGKRANVQVHELVISHANSLYVNGNILKSASPALSKSNYKGATVRKTEEGRMRPNHAIVEDSH